MYSTAKAHVRLPVRWTFEAAEAYVGRGWGSLRHN